MLFGGATAAKEKLFKQVALLLQDDGGQTVMMDTADTPQARVSFTWQHARVSAAH